MNHFGICAARSKLSAILLAVAAFASIRAASQDGLETNSVSLPLLKLCSKKNPQPCIDKPPVLTHSQDPEYSQEAHKAKIEGSVLLLAVISTDGLATDIRIEKSLGYGLDERAVKALEKWKFKPATSNGNPVPAQIAIEMPFFYH